MYYLAFTSYFSFSSSDPTTSHVRNMTIMCVLLTAGWVVTPSHEDPSQLAPLGTRAHPSHTMHPTQSVSHMLTIQPQHFQARSLWKVYNQNHPSHSQELRSRGCTFLWRNNVARRINLAIGGPSPYCDCLKPELSL